MTAATSSMKLFVKPLTIITRSSILDVAAVLNPPLKLELHQKHFLLCQYKIHKKKYFTYLRQVKKY